MPPSRRDETLLDGPLIAGLAETVVIAAWLAVPVAALLAAGALAPPLHAAGIAILLTLALRSWRATRRGQPLHRLRERLAAALDQPPPRPAEARDRPDPGARRHRARRAAPRRFPAKS